MAKSNGPLEKSVARPEIFRLFGGQQGPQAGSLSALQSKFQRNCSPGVHHVQTNQEQNQATAWNSGSSP
jgi:hypothetical protein